MRRLTITTWPAPDVRLGRTFGTSGTLTLPVPQTDTCHIQADVALQVGGVGPFVFYSGTRHILPGCGQSGSGQRFTPYWTQAKVSGTCVWEFGQMRNGKTFGGVKQYGTFTTALGLAEFASKIMPNPHC